MSSSPIGRDKLAESSHQLEEFDRVHAAQPGTLMAELHQVRQTHPMRQIDLTWIHLGKGPRDGLYRWPADRNRDVFVLREAQTEVGTLIAGPGVFICDHCVDECVTVIAHRSASVPRISPWEADLALQDVLANLGPAAEAGNQADRNLTCWVTNARSLGAP
jgi:hypothetical protein